MLNEIKKLGFWNFIDSNEITDLAYYKFLEEVKIQKDSGEWIKRESTFVMDQKYFMGNTRTGKYYCKIAMDELRNKKIDKIKDKC